MFLLTDKTIKAITFLSLKGKGRKPLKQLKTFQLQRCTVTYPAMYFMFMLSMIKMTAVNRSREGKQCTSQVNYIPLVNVSPSLRSLVIYIRRKY